MTIVERAAYLKGLAEGFGMDPNSRDGKLWGALTTLLSDMAHEIEDLQADSLDMAEAMDELGEELSCLEELALGLDVPEDYEDLEDDEDFDDDEDFADEDEPDADEEGRDYRPDLRLYREDEEDDGEDEEFNGILYDVTCPSCGQEISFDETTLDEGAITCPGCGETLEFDLGDDEE